MNGFTLFKCARRFAFLTPLAVRSALFVFAHHSIAKARRRTFLAIMCAITVVVALSGVAIPAAQSQTITTFTVQDQTQADFGTDRANWQHKILSYQSKGAWHVRHFSLLENDNEGTGRANTTASTSRFTTTINVSDPLHCGWTLRFSGQRIGYLYIWSDDGHSHAELHPVSEIWSIPPQSVLKGSLVLPEMDTGSHSKNYQPSIAQSSNARLSGAGSAVVTLTIAWDAYVSGDPDFANWDSPPAGVDLWDKGGGYYLDVTLQPCPIIRDASPLQSTLPTFVAVAPNGSCCFDVVARDSSGVAIPGAPVTVDFSGCTGDSLCPVQAPGLTANLAAETVTAISDSTGVAKFCVCGTFTSPCTPTIYADGIVLGTASVAPCPPTPGPTDAYAVADDQYRVVFDTDVTPASATNVANYALASFGTVNSAVMDGSRAVILTVIDTGLSHGQPETVTVNGVVGSPDGIAMTTPRGVTFLAGALSVAEVRAPDPDSLASTPCVDQSRFAGPDGTSGARVTIHGIATTGSDGMYYLQDESGGPRCGIRVWSPSDSLVAGHRYTVAGSVGMQFGVNFSDVVDLRDDGVGTPPAPMDPPLSVLLDPTCDASQSLLTRDDFEGALVRVDTVMVTADADSAADFTVAGPYPTFQDTIEVANDHANSGFVPIAGQILQVTGVLAAEGRDWVLQPRTAADVTVIGPVVGVRPRSYQLALGAAHPNPSSGSVSFSFTMAKQGPASIRVYDVAGRLVKTLVSGKVEAGPQNITWDASDDGGHRVGAGVYFYRMDVGTWRSQRKVVFLER
jgi:hypothetical protein